MRRFGFSVALVLALVVSFCDGYSTLLLPQSGDKLGAGGHLKMHRVFAVDSTAPDTSAYIDSLGNLRIKGLRVNGVLLGATPAQLDKVNQAVTVSPAAPVGALSVSSSGVTTGSFNASALQISGTTMLSTAAQLNQAGNVSQPGLVMMWPTTSAPGGWLVCDGSAVSRSTYASLYAVIGTVFGSGDGSTTFNLPSFKGRSPAGYDSGQSEFNAIGKTGGEKTHLLNSAESGTPQHQHLLLASTSVTSTTLTGSNYIASDRDGYGNFSYGMGLGGTSITPSVGLSGLNAGASAGSAHNVLDPYISMVFIIKY